MILLFVLILLFRRYGTYGAPVPTLATTTWEPESTLHIRNNLSNGCQTRTLWNILSSCLATTFACTWVSVHPNVPLHGDGRWSFVKRRAFLVFFSMLAPEVMIMWAFKQWRGAVMICQLMKDARPQIRKSFNHIFRRSQ